MTDDDYVITAPAAMFAAQDDILIGLAGTPVRLDQALLRRLPPWRAVMLARLAHKVGAMNRRDLDALVREAVLTGGDGALRPPKP